MARIRVLLVTAPNGIGPAAPTFTQVPGSFAPTIPGKVVPDGILVGIALGDPSISGVTVQVDVPDDDVTGSALDHATIKRKYPDHWLVTSGVVK